ncbi:MAG: hypothetical protein K2K63_17510 [Acetatifactor sp.]|nr:hypothetical protein [Acetatifactor sp.]
MSVNGVTSQVQSTPTYDYSTTENVKATEKKDTNTKAESSSAAGTGVVYEPSKEVTTDSAKKTYKPNTDLVNKLKADAEARTSQLRSLVEKMMSGQTEAYGKATNMWQFLRSGNYTVDAATKLQAQKDISEDGYWGVKQTSSRILDFATALTGGDPDKIEDMRKAFEKGYKQAEKTWGGKLPDISQQTYDAVMKGFDDMAAAVNKTVTE